MSEMTQRDIDTANEIASKFCVQCDGSGAYQVDEDEVAQCQWCDQIKPEVSKLIAQALHEARLEGREEMFNLFAYTKEFEKWLINEVKLAKSVSSYTGSYVESVLTKYNEFRNNNAEAIRSL